MVCRCYSDCASDSADLTRADDEGETGNGGYENGNSQGGDENASIFEIRVALAHGSLSGRDPYIEYPGSG